MEPQSHPSSFPTPQHHPAPIPSDPSAPPASSSTSPLALHPTRVVSVSAPISSTHAPGVSPMPIPHLAPASTLLAHSAPPIPSHHHQAAVAAAAAAAAHHHAAAVSSHAHQMLAAAAAVPVQVQAAHNAPINANSYYEAYIATLEQNRRLQATLESSRLENERLRERVAALEKSISSTHRPDPPKAQSRYWTPDEHQRFLDALQEYGPKDVRSIASYVGSRNPTQVRTHAQKYFLRRQREASKGLANSRKRSMSESDLARVDRLHSQSAGTPPPSPPPRFPLPKPPFKNIINNNNNNSTNTTATSTSATNLNNTNSKIDGREAALLLQLADARAQSSSYNNNNNHGDNNNNKEGNNSNNNLNNNNNNNTNNGISNSSKHDMDRLPPPSAIIQQPIIPRRSNAGEFPPPRPPRQTKMEIDP